MKEFVIRHQKVLKRFRLTGTNSTMTMLKSVLGTDDVAYGPTCSSGPLGGDAEVRPVLIDPCLPALAAPRPLALVRVCGASMIGVRACVFVRVAGGCPDVRRGFGRNVLLY